MVPRIQTKLYDFPLPNTDFYICNTYYNNCFFFIIFMQPYSSDYKVVWTS